MENLLIKSCVALLAVGLISNASAYEAGDFIVRAGAAMVDPQESSGTISPASISLAGEVGIDNDVQLGLTGTYMVTDNIGIELLAATPFTHTITLEGDLAGLGSLATAKHLPPTVSLQYFFNNDSSFTPYIGAGVNYTMMLETEITSNGEAVLGSLGITDTSVEADDSVGLSLQAGLDMALTDNIILGAAVWYMDIETEIEVANAVTVDLDIDP
jgi:outer membrane protein|tara:strand:+ start:2590 stop:3231 length:642 start_codon:yes stop_codon:yes gene_type:complete